MTTRRAVAVSDGIARVPESVRGDYTALALAVVQTAFDNVAAYGRARGRGRTNGYKPAHEAIQWALENSEEECGFRWWCALACVNADQVRTELFTRWGRLVQQPVPIGDGTRWESAEAS